MVLKFGAVTFPVEIIALADEIEDARELSFSSIGHLKGYRVGIESLTNAIQGAIEISSESIHLVDEGNSWNFVMVSLTPNCFRLGLNASNSAKDSNSAIQYTERTLYFDGEIDVARSVDDVDIVVFPLDSSCGCGDGDASLLLLFHPVHGGRATVDFSQTVFLATVEEHALGRGRLSRVDVGHDSNVSESDERVFLVFLGHFMGWFRLWWYSTGLQNL